MPKSCTTFWIAIHESAEPKLRVAVPQQYLEKRKFLHITGTNDIITDNTAQEEVTAAASSLAAPKHSVSRFQRCYSDGSQGSPNMRRKQLGSASQKVCD